MNLKDFKQNLNEENIIFYQESKNVKGGLRYETYSYSSFMKKVSRLNNKGISPSCNIRNGHYCIEW